ncbi:hypothetical protein AAC387_Pa10g0738 [Persea americana]
MIKTSKDSFSFSAIRKFVGRRPSLEALVQWVHSSWRLSKPCLILLTKLGHFLFRFNTMEERDVLVSQGPLFMGKRKLLLHPWSPRQDESSWPVVTPVWIRLKGIPYHCWIGKPLRLDETATTQRMLSYARVLVNLDVTKPGPNSLTVELEGDATVEVEILYENVPCYDCLYAGHLSVKCPYSTS